MGSGSLAAMAIFETEWQAGLEVRILHICLFIYLTFPHFRISDGFSNLKRDAAVALVSKAIQAGIFNDLGSGSNVDVCIITKDRTEMLRNYLRPNERVEKERRYVFRRGTTDYKKDREIIRSLVVHEESRPHDTMDES